MSLENPLEPSIPFDPSLFPRTYQSSLGYRLLLISLGALLAAGSLLGLWYFGTGQEATSPQGTLILLVVCLAFFLLGAYLVVAMLKSKIILTADAIELHEPFVTKQLLRSQIAGWRVIPTQYVPTLEFTPRDPHAKKLKFAFTIKSDAAFQSWLATLRNLDAEELAESRAELETNQELGFTEEQRSDRLASAANCAKYLNFITYAAAAWGWFYPQPYSAAILVCSVLPLAAIFLGLRAKGVYQFDGRRNDVRPSLALPVIVPGAVLSIRALYDLSLLHWQKLVAPVLFVTIVLTAFIASADPSIARRRWPLLAIFLLSAFYGAGATTLANALLDRSEPQIYETKILHKHVSTGRHTSWELELAPWGPQNQSAEVSVPRTLYNSVQPGDIVCIQYHPGTLKIPWYLVALCPATPNAAQAP
jgi:hypothetical protein